MTDTTIETPDHPFKIGDRLIMKAIVEMADRATAQQFAVTVTDVGTCDDDDVVNSCGKPTVHFLDPESGEPDEAHAEDFELM